MTCSIQEMSTVKVVLKSFGSNVDYNCVRICPKHEKDRIFHWHLGLTFTGDPHLLVENAPKNIFKSHKMKQFMEKSSRNEQFLWIDVHFIHIMNSIPRKLTTDLRFNLKLTFCPCCLAIFLEDLIFIRGLCLFSQVHRYFGHPDARAQWTEIWDGM